MEDRKNARSAILFVFLLCIGIINTLIRFLLKARNVIDKKDGDIGRLTDYYWLFEHWIFYGCGGWIETLIAP